MKSTHNFDILNMPPDPYEAEKFVLDQVKACFGHAHTAGLVKAKDFAMIRNVSAYEPFRTDISVVLVFDGDESKTFVHTTGQVTAGAGSGATPVPSQS